MFMKGKILLTVCLKKCSKRFSYDKLNVKCKSFAQKGNSNE